MAKNMITDTATTRSPQQIVLPKAVDEIVRRLVEEFKPLQVILFGSYAWGNPTADSDIDLLVILPESHQRPIEREIRAHTCLQGITTPKDIIVRTQAEVEHARQVVASLERKVLDEGLVLYG
jgi:uncharacterized protein